MSINFPTSLDSLSNPASGNPLNSPSHSLQHSNANDAIEALEAKVGANSSAVTTSHDYKLSGVTGTDKAVSKTGSETLTNKTLTSPVINLGTNATGDMYYRDTGGSFQRLPIGTAGQILDVSSGGIPEWIANPSAADASTTVKGVVEIATTAEITAGTSTGGTGAILVVPASAVGSAGASKLVQFDGSGKYPAADGSAITNLTGSSISDFNFTSNSLETRATYYAWTSHLLGKIDSGPTYVLPGWSYGAITGSFGDEAGGAGSIKLSSNTLLVYSNIPGNGNNTTYTAASSKAIRLKFRARFASAGASNYVGIGIADASSTFDDIETSTVSGIRFALNNTTLYASTGNGSSNNNTDLSSFLTYTDWNIFEIVFTPGTNAKFYVNGTLRATHSTNLPTGSLQYFGLGASASYTFRISSEINFSIEQ